MRVNLIAACAFLRAVYKQPLIETDRTRIGTVTLVDQPSRATLLDLVADNCNEPLGLPVRLALCSIWDDVGFDPLAVLLEARSLDLWIADDVLRFPINLFSTQRASTSRKLGFDVIDTHLHSGATLRLSAITSALAETASLAPGSEGENLSLPGHEYSVREVMGALRWITRMLWVFKGIGAAVGRDAWQQAGLAESMLELLDTPAGFLDGLKSADLRERISAVAFPPLGRCPSVGELLQHGLSSMQPRALEACHTLVSLLVAVHDAVTSRKGEGLTRFVERFVVADAISDFAVGDRQRARLTSAGPELISDAVADVLANTEVVGAEFRKTIRAPERSAFKRKALESLKRHAIGFALAAEDRGAPLRLSMPLTFERRNGCRNGVPDPLSELRHAVNGAQAIRDLTTRADFPIDAIGGVDVVGDEYLSASWPFVAALEIVAATGLNTSAHAGESFYSLWQGLRHIGELTQGANSPARIGHALALDTETARYIADPDSVPDIPLLEVLCDCLWALQYVEGNRRAGLLRFCSALVQSDSGLEPIPITAWTLAYRKLFSIEGLLGLGLLQQLGAELRVYSEQELRSRIQYSNSVERASLALILPAHSGSDATPDMLRVLTQPEKDAYSLLSRELQIVLRQSTINSLRNTIIECCPTSNVVLANMPAYSTHPISALTNAGISCTVSSDDPLLFNTTVFDEFCLLQDAGVDSEILKSAAERSLESTCSVRARTSRDWQAVAASL